MADDVARQIARRTTEVGLVMDEAQTARLTAYLGLLTKWNAVQNLTALPLEPLTDEAIDRLVLEPVAAARYCRTADELAIDVGSGSGSPALPLKIAAPWLRMMLVESRGKKAAFLREAVRELDLRDIEVQTRRFEDFVAGRADDDRGGRGAADLVTLRGVRLDRNLWMSIRAALRPGGRVFWFTTSPGTGAASGEPPTSQDLQPARLIITGRHQLVRQNRSELVVLSQAD